jgi:glycosyltransferase involved in cell wall biosynthesis
MKQLLRNGYRAAMALQSLTARTGGSRLRVFYGGARAGDIGGPLVKVKRLRAYFPEQRWGYNLVYSLSGAPYLPAVALRRLKRRGVPLVCNQNGVFYEAWYDGDWRARNAEMAVPYHLAGHVFWQSAFCRNAAQRFLGTRQGPGEVLYNAIDTDHFRPVDTPREDKAFTFLITGKIDSHIFYRIEASLKGLAAARAGGLDARLIVAGWMSSQAAAKCRELSATLDLGDVVTMTGPYTQEDAPAVYRSADAYLMLKHNDPCPNAVLEALACGLPVLYSDSGGVPELVGDDCGVALACTQSRVRPHWPAPAAVAAGMGAIADNCAAIAANARHRAVERFDIAPWIERHRVVFNDLLDARS